MEVVVVVVVVMVMVVVMVVVVVVLCSDKAVRGCLILQPPQGPNTALHWLPE